MLLSSVSALIAPTVGWFCVVYLFLGTNLGTEVMARYNLSVEYGPVEHRSTYVGLTNTLLAPFFLSGILGGIISDLWGYPVMFACGIGFSLVGISLLTFRVRDPRLSTVQSGDLPAGVR
jgi:MFS family permease